MEQKTRAANIEERYLKYRRYYAGAVGCENGGRNKMEERYLKYRHYYAGIDIIGFGGYGKAVYAHLFPSFDQWYSRKSLDDVPPNIMLLEDKLYLTDHPDYRQERGSVISFHIKVMALSMVGVIIYYKKDVISRQMLQYIISYVSDHTMLYDYSDCWCFGLTVNMFVDMLKEEFSHFGTLISDLSIGDFANEETLNPKPQPVISML
jgi:hypothetical protein